MRFIRQMVLETYRSVVRRGRETLAERGTHAGEGQFTAP
jgi:hypothetical protein